MSKLKSGLFSFEARGTLGDVVTYQHDTRRDYARRKPTPTDPKSEAQLRRRHNFSEICAWWGTLSAAEKATYLSNARPHRITGFNLFQQEQLALLPNLLSYHPFNEGGGSLAADFSAHGNTGTIYGAVWRDDFITPCLEFDGIDNYVDIGNSSIFNLTPPFTFEICLEPHLDQVGNVVYVISKDASWMLTYDHPSTFFRGTLAFYADPGGWQRGGQVLISKNVKHLLTGVYDPPNIITMLDGSVAKTVNVGTFAVRVNANHVIIGANTAIAAHFDGLLDEPRIYNYAESLTDHQRHYERMASL